MNEQAKQEAIERLECHLCELHAIDTPFDKDIRTILDALYEADGAPKWVSVKERLPEKDGEYLVWRFNKEHFINEPMVAFFTHGLWYNDRERDDLYDVGADIVRWLPIPEYNAEDGSNVREVDISTADLKALAAELTALREKVEKMATERRSLSRILSTWHKHEAKLAKILGVSGIQDEVEDAVKSLISERDRYKTALEHYATGCHATRTCAEGNIGECPCPDIAQAALKGGE